MPVGQEVFRMEHASAASYASEMHPRPSVLIGFLGYVVSAAVPVMARGQTVTVTCASSMDQRQHCAADTSKGIALQRSFGMKECLLGKTWGYDDTGVWV